MNAKRFVSLFFNSDKLQLIYLNEKKNLIEKLLEVDIPPGLIVNNQVLNQTKLVQIISDLWKTSGLKEKHIGIVVPEVSTFIKFLELPKVKPEELDEAVRWQSQDLLPGSGKDMVVDWKIINSDVNSYNILVVGIRQEILAGYVQAVGQAGLYPLVVETPALALARVSGLTQQGRLIIYTGGRETLIVITQGEKIIGSTITQTVETEIIKVIDSIFRHYNDIKIEKISIGGIGVNQSLINAVAHKFSVQPYWITPKVSGFDPIQMQKYLIPLSLQLRSAAEPRDEFSINLLPEDWVKKYLHNKFRKQVFNLAVNTSLILFTILILTFGYLISLKTRLNNLRNENRLSGDSKYQEILSEVQKINRQTDEIARINSVTIDPGEIINLCAGLITDGIYISTYKINFDTGEILLTGKATDRTALVNYKTNLEKSEKIEKVNLPLKSLESEINLEFTISLYLKLKEQTDDTGTIKIN